MPPVNGPDVDELDEPADSVSSVFEYTWFAPVPFV